MRKQMWWANFINGLNSPHPRFYSLPCDFGVACDTGRGWKRAYEFELASFSPSAFARRMCLGWPAGEMGEVRKQSRTAPADKQSPPDVRGRLATISTWGV